MTEVPEHLLRRSRERRAALGLGGEGSEGGEGGAGGEGGSAVTPATPAAQSTSTAPAMAETSAASRAASAAAANADADAGMEPAGAGGGLAVLEEAPLPVPVPTRPRTPFWIMPVLVALPIYAFIYFGAFGARHAVVLNDPVARGNIVFHTAGCSGCHGANGEGGVGPKLAGGEAAKTFPNVADQISWVNTGSGPFAGKKYGDPNRVGGQHGPATGGMPAFGSSLTTQQISDVVAYERTGL